MTVDHLIFSNTYIRQAGKIIFLTSITEPLQKYERTWISKHWQTYRFHWGMWHFDLFLRHQYSNGNFRSLRFSILLVGCGHVGELAAIYHCRHTETETADVGRQGMPNNRQKRMSCHSRLPSTTLNKTCSVLSDSYMKQVFEIIPSLYQTDIPLLHYKSIWSVFAAVLP